ncbi:uncharacterized protein LOC110445831 [Mizuhopecten yessoensis]|uniref:Protein sleepless n=1 Tax=Mizuhopecten yessoensis TaxID=6573 RepID=A0A210R6C2_MIZYE|nr:uncharacterized protein LOC110445831 [Mizuhopecten yessoensis]OWF56580.1 hypothetical protein KP79_PYT18682 [Mizuhopecten yessoensis]
MAWRSQVYWLWDYKSNMSVKGSDLCRVVVFMAVLSMSVCLECYDCAAKDDPICLDPFDLQANDGGTSECGDKDTHCMKFKTVSFLSDSGFITGKDRVVTVTSRMCIRRDGYSNGCVAVESDGGFLFKCLCDTDFCNGSTTLIPNLVVLVVTIFVSLWVTKR